MPVIYKLLEIYFLAIWCYLKYEGNLFLKTETFFHKQCNNSIKILLPKAETKSVGFCSKIDFVW